MKRKHRPCEIDTLHLILPRMRNNQIEVTSWINYSISHSIQQLKLFTLLVEKQSPPSKKAANEDGRNKESNGSSD